MELYAFAIAAMVLVHETRGARHVVYWDEKQIPKLANGGLEITLEVDDYMDVLCPFDTSNVGIRSSRNNRIFLTLFNVTWQKYLECNVTGGIRLQLCDDPSTEKKLTTKFQERSPYPFGFTFRPGASYYYLSKPLGDSSKGCDNAMRMMVHVKRKGTVFNSQREHERTRTYHLKHDDNKAKDVTMHNKPGNPKRPNRHHHHDKATATPPTTPPKVIIQYETQRYNLQKTKIESVASVDDAGNQAMASSRPSITTLICATALTLYLTSFWSRD